VYQASGRIDGFWGINLLWWDIAAELILVEEPMGEITIENINYKNNTDKKNYYKHWYYTRTALIHFLRTFKIKE